MHRIWDTLFPPDKINDGFSRRRVIEKTLIIFMLIFGLMVAAALVILGISDRVEMDEYRGRAWATVDTQTTNLENDIEQVFSELKILANQEEFQVVWNDDGKPVPATLWEIAEEYLVVSMYRRLYDRIRLMDEYGMEIVRIDFNNGAPAVVSQKKLQNQKGWFYFNDVFRLNRGDVFVSPLDLKMENGKIEQPPKPMMRFATPVCDKRGRKRGFVLLNYCAGKMLERFIACSFVAEGSQAMLLNCDGYWLCGPNPDAEWGFMYADRMDRTFANTFPDGWQKIKSADLCQITTPEGLFTSRTVWPLLKGQKIAVGSDHAYDSGKEQVETDAYHWKVVSFTPAEDLYASRTHRRVIAAAALFFLMLLLSTALWRLARATIFRQQAEVILRESRNHLQNVFRVAPIGIGVARHRVLEQVNEHLCDMAGYSKEELIGRNTRILYLNEKDYDYVGSMEYTQARNGGTGTVELDWRRKDGRTINILFSSAPIDPMDLSGGDTFIAMDVTERRQAEDALKISHERFLKVLDSIDAMVYVSDLESYKILFMNEHMVKNFGKSLIGEICYKGIYGKSKPCPDCRNDQLIDKNGKSNGACTWQGQNPITGKWYIYTERVIEWTDGRWVKLQMASDITHFKTMEEKLRHRHKMEAIGTLAGGIAHQFNNALAGITGHTDLLEMDFPGNEIITGYVQQMRKSSARMAQLNAQLLAYARGGKYQAKTIAIGHLVKETVSLVKHTITPAISVNIDIPGDILKVSADPTQMQMMLSAVLVNASESITGAGHIEVACRNTAVTGEEMDGVTGLKSGTFVCLSVTDDGKGMDENTKNRIFDPFFTTHFIGRGLGMSAVYGIVKNHDGWVSVDSEPGRGTIVSIYLPPSKVPELEDCRFQKYLSAKG